MDTDAPDGPPTGTVSGRAVRCVVDGVEGLPAEARERGRTALTAHDVDATSDDGWYPLVAFCSAVADILATTSADAVRELGRQVAADAAGPADGDSVPATLAVVDEVYRRRHRGEAGGYAFRRIGDRDGRVECATPYPCPFDQGFVAGVADASADSLVRLSEVGACRIDGAPRCTYELRW